MSDTAATVSEIRRLRHAQEFLEGHSMDSTSRSQFTLLTGNERSFNLSARGSIVADEWMGTGLAVRELRRLAIEHFGAPSNFDTLAFNRTSSGILGVIGSQATESQIVSLVPENDTEHASVRKAASIVGAKISTVFPGKWQCNSTWSRNPSLAIVTTTSSALNSIDAAEIADFIDSAQSHSALVLLDEAYGARVRPTLLGDPSAWQLGAPDFAITNTDKAGLSGPRGGVLVGRPDKTEEIQAWSSGLGLEARTHHIAGMIESLREWDPKKLTQEAEISQRLTKEIAEIGGSSVKATVLGPLVLDKDIHKFVGQITGIETAWLQIPGHKLVTALGMVLLKRHRMITVSALGMPGASPHLRLKPVLSRWYAKPNPERILAAVIDSCNYIMGKISKESDVDSIIYE